MHHLLLSSAGHKASQPARRGLTTQFTLPHPVILSSDITISLGASWSWQKVGRDTQSDPEVFSYWKAS